jgi:hypothetical protein
MTPQSNAERRVLVFPAGTEIGLEIYAALHGCRNIALFGAGQDISTHARFAFAAYRTLPHVNESGWFEQLVVLCQELHIDYVFPAHDDAIVALSEVRDRLPAKLVTSSHDVCTTTRSKTATYRRLCGLVAVPRVFASTDEIDEFPVLVKPDRGQGSFGVRRVDTRMELDRAINEIPEPIICAYLPGDEFTIDCFSSSKQGLLFSGARRRVRTRNGISTNTVTEELPESAAIAQAIHETLRPRGAWFFQVKRASDGVPTLLEVAPRIAGAMAAHRVAGVNFPLLSIFDQDDIPIRISTNSGRIELDRSLRNRYLHDITFEILYLDLDDTLLTGSCVNLDVVRLVFACINRRRKVILITRHADDVHATLRKHRLDGLFDEIVHITDGSPKSRHINQANSIFVDDSFSERQEVQRIHGIPTFDSSMLELLNDQAESLNVRRP